MKPDHTHWEFLLLWAVVAIVALLMVGAFAAGADPAPVYTSRLP